MWAIAGSLRVRPLLAKVSFVGEQAESKEEEGAEADPPGQREVESAVWDDLLVYGQEREEDVHQDGCNDSVDSQALSVAKLVRTHMIDSHRVTWEDGRTPEDCVDSGPTAGHRIVFLLVGSMLLERE